MRARNIKPGFFKNDVLANLDMSARVLFQGLWCLADRRGRLEDRPAKIKAEVFPYDAFTSDQMSTMLEQLRTGAFILRYEAKGNSYIQIINFEKHQYPHIREQESTIPAPCKPRSGTIRARLNPESPILNPESPLLNTATLDLAGVFESLWREYPKRRGKKMARRHFNASVKTESDVAKVRVALANYRKEVEGKDRQYIKNADTWFNNWDEYLEDSNAPNGGSGTSYFADLSRRAAQTQGLRKVSMRGFGEVPNGVRTESVPNPPAQESDRERVREDATTLLRMGEEVRKE